MIVERKYQVTVKFMPGKGKGFNPTFEFWVNEEERLHRLLLSKMVEAAASERYEMPMISKKYTGEDIISLIQGYRVKVIYESHSR